MYSYFNECLPQSYVVDQLVDALIDTTKAYAYLKKRHPSLEGVVSIRHCDSIVLSDEGITLDDCIKKISDRSVRTLIYSWLINYPVRDFLDESINEADLIEQSYTVSIAGKDHPATNLAIACNNGTFLFSLGIHSDLRKNELTLVGEGDKTLSVCNLFSNEPANVASVEQFINEAENSSLSITEQIDCLLEGRVRRTNAYIRTFNKQGTAIQQAILDRLKCAKDNNLLDFTVDNDIFRRTIGYDKKEKTYGAVYELRIREPKEIRIYFQYVDKTYYVLSMGWKGTDQNADIGQAFERIKQIREVRK